MGAMNVGQAAPYVEAFMTAKAAAAKIFHVIDRVPEIDSTSTEGKIPTKGAGDITFKDVHFNYPSRKDVKVSPIMKTFCVQSIFPINFFLPQILQGLNLTVKKGETVALVGTSGCGKSTVIQLVQRFYDPDSGTVEYDGDDIRDLNLGALRDRWR